MYLLRAHYRDFLIAIGLTISMFGVLAVPDCDKRIPEVIVRCLARHKLAQCPPKKALIVFTKHVGHLLMFPYKGFKGVEGLLDRIEVWGIGREHEDCYTVRIGESLKFLSLLGQHRPNHAGSSLPLYHDN